MRLLYNFLKSTFEKWIKDASYEELSKAYEIERQQWIKDGFNHGTGKKSYKMQRINEEINKRVAEKWNNSPLRNSNPNYRWTDINRWDKD